MIMRIAVLVMSLGLALQGCSRGGSSGSADSGHKTAATSDERTSDLDPCGLLKVDEVEAVMGKLAVPPYRIGQNGPEVGGIRCGYRTADLREMQIGATTEGGAALLKMMALPAGMAQGANLKGKLPLPEFADIAGDWDEARIIGCCILNALLGDAMIDLNFAGTKLTMEQAAQLVNAALPRIDKPLPVKGDVGVAAALAQDAQRPKERPVCSLLTRAEVEALLGPVNGEPSGSDRDCTWRYQRKGIDGKMRDWPMEVKLRWRGGFADLRDSVQLAGKVISSLVGGTAPPPESANIEGPWDEAAAVVDFMAVRKDVIVRIDLRVSDQATAQKFAGALLQKL
ncbi:MAG: hypothetical protein ABI616_10720 [Pseudomonadota bacterium]